MHDSTHEKAADLLQQAMQRAKRQGASAALLRWQRKQELVCNVERAKLKTVEAGRQGEVVIDLVVDGRRGRTTLTDLAHLPEMVDQTVTLAQAGSDAHFREYPPAGTVADVKTHSARTASLPRERMIEACRRISEALRAFDPDLYLQAEARRQEVESLIVSSGGVCHRQMETDWTLFAWAQRVRGTDMLFAEFWRQGRDFDDSFDPDRISGEILADLRMGETVVPAAEGPTVVLLSPALLDQFLRALRMGVNGRNVAKGDSPLRGRLGEQVLDPCITLVDDPHLDYHIGAHAISDEGIPTRRTTLFERGVLRSFLYDVDTAGLAGAAPTGHNGCAPWSLDLAPGQRSHEELLASIPDGLYVKELMGFGQGNLINGDFSCNVAVGFRIQGGRIVGRVKNTMLAGNIYGLLKRDVELSRDKDPVTRMPYAVLRGATVSTKA